MFYSILNESNLLLSTTYIGYYLEITYSQDTRGYIQKIKGTQVSHKKSFDNMIFYYL